MSAFAAAVEAMLKGDTVRYCYGVTFQFASGAMSVWQGFGELDATPFGGPLFSGVGNMGSIGSVEIGTSAQTQSVTFQLSGVDPKYSAYARNQATEIKGRRALLYLLFFTGSGPDAGASLLDCRLRRTLRMDKITGEIQANQAGLQMVNTLVCEPILATKSRAPYAMLSDSDQRARHPGDRACEFMCSLTGSETIVWN